MASSESDIRIMIKRQLETVYDKKEKKLRKFCDDLCERAVNFRLDNPRAHDFTGNLLNSIVVALYRRGKLVQATFSSGIVPSEIAPKMTYPKTYHWKVDYSGVERSYQAEVKTDSGYGTEDAKSFIVYYDPNPNAIFEIVCAYTTEYASWVEMERATTGYLQMVEFVKIGVPSVIKK